MGGGTIIELPPSKTYGKTFARHALILCIGLLSAFLSARAVESNAAFGNDGIDRTDPNFVTASLLVMGPENELYSCAGHSCIRLECPKFNLDYIFTYESERISDKIFTFFMGKLKMGMFAIPTADYLKLGQESGRGVMQYRLNLPPDAKQRLWKLLDDRVAEGPCLPYDYMERGCAQSAMTVLREALRPYEMTVNSWPEKYGRKSRHELLEMEIRETYPWQMFILYTICGFTTDDGMSKVRKVCIPSDLHDILCVAKVNGVPLIDGNGEELISRTRAKDTPPRFTPFIAAWILVAIVIGNFFLRSLCIDWMFWTFQVVLGVFFFYMVLANLTAYRWHWLIVPFNLLPLVFWKWRKKWALGFAGVLLLWEIGMIAYPHRLTDPAYLVLVAAYVMMYARIGWPWRTAVMVGRDRRARRWSSVGHDDPIAPKGKRRAE